MTVNILLFGSLKELLGKSSLQMTWKGRITVQDLFCQILEDKSNQRIQWQKQVLYAINQEQVPADSVVNDGDEVAFMPPMSGG